MKLNLRKLLVSSAMLVLVTVLASCAPNSSPQEISAPPQPTTGENGAPDADSGEVTKATSAVQTPHPQPNLSVEEQILIAEPGPNSSVTSPFVVEGIAVAPFEGLLGARLTNANGVALAEVYPQVNAQMGQKGPYRQEMMFSGVEEETPARLLVYAASPKDGGLVHASSVVIRLLPSGEAQINPPDDPQEEIEISSPANGEVVGGGELTVTGKSDYFFESNLALILCGEGGGSGPHMICGDASNVLAEGNANIDSPDIGIEGAFEGVLQYTVDTEINARLVVYAISPMDGDIEHLSSVEIILAP